MLGPLPCQRPTASVHDPTPDVWQQYRHCGAHSLPALLVHKNKPRLHRRSQICPANKLTTRKHANRTQCSGTPPASTPYTWTLACLTMHVSGPKHPLHMDAHNAELLCKFQVTLRLKEKKNPSRQWTSLASAAWDIRDAKPS